MFKTLKKRIKNEKGLSLVELLAVIVILAIVSAIAIPAIGNIINNSRDKAVLSDYQSLISTAKIAYVDGECAGADGCTADSLDFKSDKIDTSKAVIKFDTNGVASIATTGQKNDFKGKRLTTKYTDKKLPANTTETTLNELLEGK